MSDRRNQLGWCMGNEVKKFVRDVMETWNWEYGFIIKWINCGYYGSKEEVGLKIVWWKSGACCG